MFFDLGLGTLTTNVQIKSKNIPEIMPASEF